MKTNSTEDTKALKRELIELEELRREEKECLLKVISAFSVLSANRAELEKDVTEIKGLVSYEKDPLPIGRIEESLVKLKNKILIDETDGAAAKELNVHREKVLEACGLIKKMMVAILEDFYPLSQELQAKAAHIEIHCHDDVDQLDFKNTTDGFMNFIKQLKDKISEDFRYINKTFIVLLDQIKALERSFTKELGSEEVIKEIEYFEMKINHEVGALVNSFDIYTTISEVKSAVVEKISNIKRIVSLRKRDETKRARIARENIRQMQARISEAESQAKEMSRKAETLEMVAMRDGLTGLYNRSAFDYKIGRALEGFHDDEQAFSLIVFDLDKFKEINDTLGHVAGDTVLKKVAECLKETFREGDFVARYGGDEFVVLIERLTKEMARERIMSFRRNLAKKRFVSYKKGEVELSVSAGIATVMQGDTPETIIERADKAMYAMKHGTR
jgi:diguanylate cyclase